MSIKGRWQRILTRKPTERSNPPSPSETSSSSSSSDIAPVQSAPPAPPARLQRRLVRTLTTWHHSSKSRTGASNDNDEKRETLRIWVRRSKSPRKLSENAQGKAPWQPGDHPGDRPLNEMNLEHQEMLGKWSWAAGPGRRTSEGEYSDVSPGASPLGSIDVLAEGVKGKKL